MYFNLSIHLICSSEMMPVADICPKFPKQKKADSRRLFLFSIHHRFYYTFSLFAEAEKNSLFILAIFVRLIPLGHSASQAPVFVQAPKPSASI